MNNLRDWKWNLRFHELAEYKRAHGDCNVPRKDGPTVELGRWVGKQRVGKHKSELSAEREAQLNAIGFEWGESRGEIVVTDWDTRFEQLREYRKAHGDFNVRKNPSPDVLDLMHWIALQRHLKKKKQISEKRKAKLNSVGFIWHAKPNNWNTRFEQLLEYKLANGDCNVSQNDSQTNVDLRRWVKTQRRAKKNSQMSEEREAKLSSIGFDWEKVPLPWIARNEQRLEKIKRSHHEIFDGPERCSGNNPPHLHKLATEHQFSNRPKEVLEKESGVQQLKTSDNDYWDTHFRELLAYLQAHGDFNVPRGDPRNPLLARWVIEQRNAYDLKRRGDQTRLTPLREAKLDAIGFTWFAGGTDDNAPAEGVGMFTSLVRPEEARSGN